MATISYRFKPHARVRTTIPGSTVSAEFWEARLKSSPSGALGVAAKRLSELRYPKLSPAEALAGAATELQAEVGYKPTALDVLNYVRGLIAPPF